MRIFLTGGTGFVGHHLRKALVNDGHEIVILTRHAHQAVEKGISWITGDITEVDKIIDGMEGCQAVINLIGIITETKSATFERIHVEGTAAILTAMRRLKIARLLQMSALGAKSKASTHYYQSKWSAEELVRGAGIEYTIFRPSFIFGPGDGFINTIVHQLIHYPIIPIIGSGEYTFSPVSVHVITEAMTKSLSADELLKCKTFELCGPDSYTYSEIVKLLAKRLNRHKPIVHISERVMTLLIALAGVCHLAFPITHEQMTMLLAGSSCKEDIIFELLSLPHISLSRAIQEYVGS